MSAMRTLLQNKQHHQHSPCYRHFVRQRFKPSISKDWRSFTCRNRRRSKCWRTARLMARVVELREAGHAAVSIAERLNAEGFYPPKRNGQFTAPVIYQLLKRRR